MPQPDDYVWLQKIAEKIRSEHLVEPYEVEEVFEGRPRIFRGPKGHCVGEDVYIRHGSDGRGTLSVRDLHQEAGWAGVDFVRSRHDCQGETAVWEEVI